MRDDGVARIEVGRRWARLRLEAAARGLSVHPVSQALQEYPEMIDIDREAHAALARDRGRAQTPGGLGYALETPPAPHWPLDAKLAGESA